MQVRIYHDRQYHGVHDGLGLRNRGALRYRHEL